VQRRDLEVVERNARTLLAQVGNLLDLSKLDAGKMDLARTTVDLAALTRLAAGHFETAAEVRHITLAVDTPSRLLMQLDGEKIQRVLLNLLSNAIKFTPGGGTVHCAVEPEENQVVVMVEDTGPGVPPELRDAIFERFRQVDGGATRQFGGTGLGLAIVREFVELHGGTIAVGDAPGGGASFRVVLPLEQTTLAGSADGDGSPAGVDLPAVVLPPALDGPAVDVAQVDAAAADAGRPLVLIVEDNPEIARFVGSVLAPAYRIAIARDGEEGLRQAIALGPDLILSDVMMPRMSGDQLVRALRAREDLASVPIVLLTARAQDDLRVELLRAGAQDYLLKPFAPEELHARVDNLVHVKQARDILQRRLASQQEDIAVLAVEAQDAIRLRDEFLAVASHELKTPITGLLGQTQLLLRRARKANMSERDQEAARVIVEQAQRLNALVATLLDVSRIQGGQFQITREPLDLCDVVRRVVVEVEPWLDRHTLAVTFAKSVLPVVGDAVRLEQVVQNLLGNAIKYSPEGGPIAVRVERRQDEAWFVVRDEGIGIPAAARERIFERFYRADNVDPMQLIGFGIGLYIVHEIVTRHGGQVMVDSVEGEGSTFTVRLPLLSPQSDNLPAPA
jgi:signal transduction histidine kinase